VTSHRLGRRCLLTFLLVSPMVATPEASAPPLRWPEVAAAVARQPLVLEAEARARGATGVVWSAQEVPNPVVTAAGGEATARDGTGSRREWGLAVELPLDFLATRGPRVASAKASAAGVTQEATGVRAQVLRTLRRDFVALAHAQALLEAGLELEVQVGQLAALVRKRADRGEARPTEVPRVEIEHERLRSGLDRVRAGLEARRQRLSTWLGSPVSRVDADLAQALPLPPLEALSERVVVQAPSVQASRARLTAASEALSAERWSRLPGLTLGGAHVEELDRIATTVTAAITIPLWNWNSGRIRQAEAALEGERARLDATNRELTAALSDAWRGCAAGQSSARRFREAILPRAEVSARTTGRAFELGETGLLDVIDTRRVLLDSRREYLDLLLDMQNACGDLAALAGLELP
jgi:cobalt-zinc-cadmium efflux system outer membrane protein